MKRLFAIVLCLAMLMSYAVPAAYAAEGTTSTDDIYVSDGATINDLTTETEETVTSPVVEDSSDEAARPACDCGNPDAEMVNHSDTCTLKRYYVGICGLDALEIYKQWETFPEDAQSYIL